ncbi:ribosome recycling factor [Crocinitomix catalasitica]|uniref:ribosome recycling factor n=1 Tax=Crocinitomix catalasitica TaxID=184607 RepID=UPI0004820195|nr:ribosome recycling factor [Crocinitomix catalasitica]|tara:strand:- start:52 stop:615 length:564 start_codon:yes stop_codon:yes gene_type:complete
MEEEIQMLLEEAKESNSNSIQHLITSLEKIRAGKATPSMLDSVMVEAYGSVTPINQVANVNTIDARTITVQPWDKSNLDAIATGIINSNLGLNPQNNGESILINVPMLTEERRRDLVKSVKNEGELAKVSVRNNRKESNDFIKKLKADGLSEDRMKGLEAEIQQFTDDSIKKIDALVDKKEVDIMTI